MIWLLLLASLPCGVLFVWLRGRRRRNLVASGQRASITRQAPGGRLGSLKDGLL